MSVFPEAPPPSVSVRSPGEGSVLSRALTRDLVNETDSEAERKTVHRLPDRRGARGVPEVIHIVLLYAGLPQLSFCLSIAR